MLSLEDERQIAAVILRYATGIDQRDWGLFETCFTEDCQCDYAEVGQWKSAKEITAFMIKSHLHFGHTLHRMSNIVVDGNSEKATARTYVDVMLVPLDRAKSPVRIAAYYEDVFLKTAAGWRIAQRRLVPVIMPVPKGLN